MKYRGPIVPAMNEIGITMDVKPAPPVGEQHTSGPSRGEQQPMGSVPPLHLPERADVVLRQAPSFAYYGPPLSIDGRRPTSVNDSGYTATYSNHGGDSVGDPPSFGRYGPPTEVGGNTFTFYTVSQTTESGGSAVVIFEPHPPPQYTVVNVP
ncbi:hypothetical protein FA13DRAFT_1075684 [Coprinellus micaceus]|uniref:Uncharacterized protein n=1 Tax=Coprinellus micaceus TaxID=71717 RepID=A0A4Y7TR37_COPMI|nr:hypothetical protein FA13DRAFT_1075684 [Coprinellus micaceus]